LTATGILANNADLETQLHWLDTVPQLELGVHLNLTFKQPLTTVMREKLARWNGLFPNAYVMSLLIVTGKISVATVRAEWCAQIEACQHKKLVFFKFPRAYPHVARVISIGAGISENLPHSSCSLDASRMAQAVDRCGLIRNSLMQTMQLLNQRHINTPTPLFLGLSRSGRLDYDALALIFSTLKAGQCYELMCHVGHFDAREITDPRLIAYHDWEAELALLQSPQLHTLYQRFNIQLSHYSQLSN